MAAGEIYKRYAKKLNQGRRRRQRLCLRVLNEVCEGRYVHWLREWGDYVTKHTVYSTHSCLSEVNGIAFVFRLTIKVSPKMATKFNFANVFVA